MKWENAYEEVEPEKVKEILARYANEGWELVSAVIREMNIALSRTAVKALFFQTSGLGIKSKNSLHLDTKCKRLLPFLCRKNPNL